MVEAISSDNTIEKNIPVKLGLLTWGKQLVHDFCSQTWVVKLCRYFSPFHYQRENAEKILQLRDLILTPVGAVSIVGGDALLQLKNCICEQVNPTKTALPLRLSVTLEDSLEAAFRLKEELGSEKIAILNMANRWQVGGVYRNPFCRGSQEEALFRASNLFCSLSSSELGKKFGKMRVDGGFTTKKTSHHIPYFGAVVSEEVTFSRKNQRQQFSVISAAAPDMRKGSDESTALRQENCWEKVMTAKIQAIFEAAIRNGATKLVLGAFGCGCFVNDPWKVASLFKKIMDEKRYQGQFSQIVFAIKDSPSSPTYQAFQGVFADSIVDHGGYRDLD